MLRTVVVLTAICGVTQSSGVVPIASVANAPIVTAASSQYFERTFNRLVAVPSPPVIPVAPAPVIPIAPPPPVFVQPVTRTVPVTDNPSFNEPEQPNVAIAIATANAAAPVATILLPPYPFGPPPIIGFVPPERPINVPDDRKEATTTTRATTQMEVKTTVREQEATTPLPSNSDNNFVQALPSNENVNFKQYYAPPLPSQQVPLLLPNAFPSPNVLPRPYALPRPNASPRPYALPRPNALPRPLPKGRPLKLKTSVEVVPVPLAYIAPPPIANHQAIKVVKHVYAFVPSTRAKIIIRPARIRNRSVKIPAHLGTYGAPLATSNARSQNVRSISSREVEPTTFRPFNRPNTKPPRL